MSTWKILVILVMIAGLAGYGIYQQKPPPDSSQTDSSQASVQSTGTPAPSPDEKEKKLQRLVGTEPKPWSFPIASWDNTKAPIQLNDLKGHVSVIEFWRSGCPHCEDAVPLMNLIFTKYSSKGLKMVTFQSPGMVDDPENPENDWEKVKTWITDHNIQYPVAFDEGGKLRKVYGVDLYPMVFVLDRHGKIRYANTGHDAAKAQQLLQAVDKQMKSKQ